MGCLGSKLDSTPDAEEESVAARGAVKSERIIEDILKRKRDSAIRIGGDEELKTVRKFRTESDSIEVIVGDAYYIKTTKERKLLSDVLHTFMVFSCLEEEQIENLVDKMVLQEAAAGERIITQGKAGKKFYVIRDGSFDVKIDGNHVRTLGSGQCFGEIALMYECPRAASVFVSGEGRGSLFWMDRFTFRKTIAEVSKGDFTFTVDTLRKMELFNGLTDQQLRLVAESCEPINFNPGDQVISKGTAGKVLYLIEIGAVECKNIGDGAFSDVNLGPGDHFGEQSLLNDEPRSADVFATAKSRILAIDRSCFLSIVGSLREAIDQNIIIRAFEHVPILSQLPRSERKKLAGVATMASLESGKLLFSAGEMSDSFMIIKSGQAVAIDKLASAAVDASQIGPGQTVGDQDFFESKPRTQSIVSSTEMDLFRISRESFERVLGPLQKVLEQYSLARKQEAMHQEFVSKITLDSIEFGPVVRTTPLGSIRFAMHVPTRKHVLVKEFCKAKLEDDDMTSKCFHERDIIRDARTPFCMRYYASLHDTRNAYVIGEALLGGFLVDQIPRLTLKGEDAIMNAARFYAASALCALETLHERGIVYRGLSPKNIMLDETGYVRLADFEFAMDLQEAAYTVCGSPSYMAPEMLLGTGHSFGVDYWCLGILIYEMVYGTPPFTGSNQLDDLELCTNILNADVAYPEDCPEALRDLLEGLLNRSCRRRLGCQKTGAKGVKDHPWFTTFSWHRLYNRELPAPWTPDAGVASELAYFITSDAQRCDSCKDSSLPVDQTIWTCF